MVVCQHRSPKGGHCTQQPRDNTFHIVHSLRHRCHPIHDVHHCTAAPMCGEYGHQIECLRMAWPGCNATIPCIVQRIVARRATPLDGSTHAGRTSMLLGSASWRPCEGQSVNIFNCNTAIAMFQRGDCGCASNMNRNMLAK